VLAWRPTLARARRPARRRHETANLLDGRGGTARAMPALACAADMRAVVTAGIVAPRWRSRDNATSNGPQRCHIGVSRKVTRDLSRTYAWHIV